MSSSTVLVVHAAKSVSEAIQVALEADGHQVLLAADGLGGLSAVEQQIPDIIIMDTMLPGLDGVTLLKALRGRSDTEETPVIIVSGRVDPDAMLTGFAAGARYYVTLPFRVADLQAKVRRLLGD